MTDIHVPLVLEPRSFQGLYSTRLNLDFGMEAPGPEEETEKQAVESRQEHPPPFP